MHNYNCHKSSEGSNGASITGRGPGGTKISLAKLTTFPQFLRFKNIRTWYSMDFAPALTDEKYKFVESCLSALKSILNDSNVIEFNADIYEHCHSYFSNHTQLLDYLRCRFLPIFFNSSHHYKFYFRFKSEGNSAANVIASILQMPEIKRCSTVEIEIHSEEQRLPVDAIINWLEESANEMEINNGQNQNKKERFLKVIFFTWHWCWGNRIRNSGIQNAGEMLDHLKTVISFKNISNGKNLLNIKNCHN